MIKYAFPVFLFLGNFSCQFDQSDATNYPEIDPDYQPDYTRWSHYLGDPESSQYSSLDQINVRNVQDLKVAWAYAAPDSGQMQMNPIIVDGILYGMTAKLRAFALDAETGKEIWLYGLGDAISLSTSRGVSYWSEGEDKRILLTIGAYLIALDAKTGKPIPAFGKNGKVDLHQGLAKNAQEKFIVSNTPGVIFENLIILPVRVSEGNDAAPGDVRAFDVKTGELAWTFHTIPHPGEEGVETWENKEAYLNEEIGGANCWAGMTLDPKAGVIFVPTGSASPDFYGGRRLGSNLFANCLLALNARTGEKIWHYQFIRHDLWDRDLPAPPNLLTIQRDGQMIDAVAQITKQGYVFVFDRKTGKPVYEIQEVPAPASNLKGEKAWATQPLPVRPEPYARQVTDLTEEDISPYANNREELLKLFRRSDKRLFGPPGLDPVLLFPGYDGGGEWGGAAIDPEEGILYVNSNEMAWLLQMEEVETTSDISAGRQIYNAYCMTCHGKDMTGMAQSDYPSLLGLKEKMTRDSAAQIISNGKGRMVGFPQLSEEEKKAILDLLFESDKQEAGAGAGLVQTLPYRHLGYKKFLDSNGLPGIGPPWGTLHAIDLNTGEYNWSVTLGETDSLKLEGFPPTGTENYGGPLVTKGGLLFIAATKDGYFRAFDKNTGQILWKTKLPFAGFATPATYEVDGQQYVVIACGGSKLGTPTGNMVVAFGLEEIN